MLGVALAGFALALLFYKQHQQVVTAGSAAIDEGIDEDE